MRLAVVGVLGLAQDEVDAGDLLLHVLHSQLKRLLGVRLDVWLEAVVDLALWPQLAGPVPSSGCTVDELAHGGWLHKHVALEDLHPVVLVMLLQVDILPAHLAVCDLVHVRGGDDHAHFHAVLQGRSVQHLLNLVELLCAGFPLYDLLHQLLGHVHQVAGAGLLLRKLLHLLQRRGGVLAGACGESRVTGDGEADVLHWVRAAQVAAVLVTGREGGHGGHAHQRDRRQACRRGAEAPRVRRLRTQRLELRHLDTEVLRKRDLVVALASHEWRHC
mmetsp:Transcript_45045/g.116729  ORF Transcript_45045/g.116729 Transcript_45045/m.116729 type:complete len:274 (+) Transcript_45045:865-1686(+)